MVLDELRVILRWNKWNGLPCNGTCTVGQSGAMSTNRVGLPLQCVTHAFTPLRQRRRQRLKAIMINHDEESEKVRQLKDDLQKAALNLIQHMGTHHFRIRIEGSMPAVYITLGEGRSSYSADSVIYHAPQEGPAQVAAESESTSAQVAAQESTQRAPPVSCFSRLKKMLVA